MQLQWGGKHTFEALCRGGNPSRLTSQLERGSEFDGVTASSLVAFCYPYHWCAPTGGGGRLSDRYLTATRACLPAGAKVVPRALSSSGKIIVVTFPREGNTLLLTQTGRRKHLRGIYEREHCRNKWLKRAGVGPPSCPFQNNQSCRVGLWGHSTQVPNKASYIWFGRK
jgi:hypothetical protein